MEKLGVQSGPDEADRRYGQTLGLFGNAIRACAHPAALLPSFGINICSFLGDPSLSQ